jgi:hypothetical protein
VATAKASAATAPTLPGAPQRTQSPPPAASTPVQPTATAAVQPGAVKPGAVKTRPAPKKPAPSGRTINPGDKVCGQCGEGNDPARKFCRRCGASLSEAVVFTLPWYKRSWNRLTTRKQRVAGDRPKTRRRLIGGHGGGAIWYWFKRIAIVAVVVVVILTFVGPVSKHWKHWWSSRYHSVVSTVHPTFTPIHPAGATASSSLPGHPPSNLIDEGSNTSWIANNRGAGQVVVLRFASLENVGKIGFLSGAQDQGTTSYVTFPRPKAVSIRFDGTSTTENITLKDTPSFQTYTTKAKNATGMTITVDSVYPATNTSNQGVAITEIELFSKK